MNRRLYRNIAVTIFFFGTIVGTFTYGPARRNFVIPARVVTVPSARELDRLWYSSGVHGRIAVIFARHVNQQASGAGFPETGFLDTAMRQGIVRRAYYVVPDREWSQVVAENVMGRELIVLPKRTEVGFNLLEVGGRIQVMPLSKYIPAEGNEKALVVVESAAWSPEEHYRINSLVSTGLLTTDLLVSIEPGTPLRAP
jgi:hypothetical protein